MARAIGQWRRILQQLKNSNAFNGWPRLPVHRIEMQEALGDNHLGRFRGSVSDRFSRHVPCRGRREAATNQFPAGLLCQCPPRRGQAGRCAAARRPCRIRGLAPQITKAPTSAANGTKPGKAPWPASRQSPVAGTRGSRGAIVRPVPAIRSRPRSHDIARGLELLHAAIQIVFGQKSAGDSYPIQTV